MQVIQVDRLRTKLRLQVAWAFRTKIEVPHDVTTGLEALQDADPSPASASARRRFGLAAVDAEVLCTVAVLALFPELGLQVGELASQFGRSAPSVTLLALLCGDAHPPHRTLAALAPDGALVSLGLVRLGDAPSLSPQEQPVFIDHDVIETLLGQPPRPSELAGLMSTVAGPRLPVPTLAPDLARGLERAFAAEQPVTVLLEGPAGSAAVHVAAALAGRPVVAVELGSVLRATVSRERFEHLVRLGVRTALAQEALPFIDLHAAGGRRRVDGDGGDGGDSAGAASLAPVPWHERWASLCRVVRHCLGPVVVSAPPGIETDPHDPRPVSRVPLAASDRAVQRQAWAKNLEGARVAGLDPDALAARFPLPLEAIHGLCDRALAYGDSGTTLDLALVESLAREQLGAETERLVRAVTTDLTWTDLVLPAELKLQLREVAEFARHRSTVLDRYGMRRWGRGGLHVLLSGEPGTGKTTAGMLLGRELGRETLQVNLDQVFSKYIGETEKHLARVFALAEEAQALLLLDEADALLAARTDVKQASDRFGNLAVNLVLQLMEQHDVISVATTNREEGLDPASLRRFAFRFKIPPPDAAAREALFRAMLPRGVAIASDVPWRAYAEQVELSGGQIRNVMQRAAALAASAGGQLSAAMVLLAINRELSQLGRLPLRNEPARR